MFYEIRSNVYMGVGSKPLNKYYKCKKKAQEYADRLNDMMPNTYSVNELRYEDTEETN